MSTWPNWVDLIILTVVFRACYVGFGRGLLTELLTLCGAVSATALTLNYARALMKWIEPWWRWDRTVGAFLTFWLLFLTCALTFRVVIRRLTQVIKWERLHWAIQGLGLVLGGLRGLWWSGFMVIALVSSGLVYLRDSVETRSVLGPPLAGLAQQTLRQVADVYPGAQGRGETLIPPLKKAPPAK